MRIFNEAKNQELKEEELDTSKGRLVQDTLVIHHDEQPFIERLAHYEVTKQYDNGGQDLVEVVDQEGQEYKPAYDEEEQIYTFHIYTEEELNKIKAEQRHTELVNWFGTYYTQHEQKYRRLNTLKIRTDEGQDPIEALKSLYLEAEEKRKEIQSLEEIIK